MADAARYIGSRVENEHGMVGIIVYVSNRCAFVDYVRYRPDDEPGVYMLTIPLADLEPNRPAPPDDGIPF